LIIAGLKRETVIDYEIILLNLPLKKTFKLPNNDTLSSNDKSISNISSINQIFLWNED
jgi:hypothetical protein